MGSLAATLDDAFKAEWEAAVEEAVQSLHPKTNVDATPQTSTSKRVLSPSTSRPDMCSPLVHSTFMPLRSIERLHLSMDDRMASLEGDVALLQKYFLQHGDPCCADDDSIGSSDVQVYAALKAEQAVREELQRRVTQIEGQLKDYPIHVEGIKKDIVRLIEDSMANNAASMKQRADQTEDRLRVLIQRLDEGLMGGVASLQESSSALTNGSATSRSSAPFTKSTSASLMKQPSPVPTTAMQFQGPTPTIAIPAESDPMTSYQPSPPNAPTTARAEASTSHQRSNVNLSHCAGILATTSNVDLVTRRSNIPVTVAEMAFSPFGSSKDVTTPARLQSYAWTQAEFEPDDKPVLSEEASSTSVNMCVGCAVARVSSPTSVEKAERQRVSSPVRNSMTSKVIIRSTHSQSATSVEAAKLLQRDSTQAILHHSAVQQPVNCAAATVGAPTMQQVHSAQSQLQTTILSTGTTVGESCAHGQRAPASPQQDATSSLQSKYVVFQHGGSLSHPSTSSKGTSASGAGSSAGSSTGAAAVQGRGDTTYASKPYLGVNYLVAASAPSRPSGGAHGATTVLDKVVTV